VTHLQLAMSKLDLADAVGVWKRCDAVCFDVDSTVCQDEAIDRLAEHCGVGKAVAEWTARAMGGGIG
jgi:phosphoserine phosphatase